jgi:hypothetical protein
MRRKILHWALVLVIIATLSIGASQVYSLGQGYGIPGQQVHDVHNINLQNSDLVVTVNGINMTVTWADLYRYQDGNWIKCGTTQSCISAGRFTWANVGPGNVRLEMNYVYPSYTTTPTPYMSYEILDRNPTAMGIWNLNGTTLDSSGNNVTGTLVGATYTSAKVGQGVSLSGNNSYVRIPYNSFNNMSSFTLNAWIYPTGLANSWGNPIISKVDPNRDFVLQLDASGRLNFHIAHGSTYYNCTSDKVVPYNKWTHVAAVYTQGGKISLYQDGILVKEATYSGIAPLWTGTIMGIGTMDNIMFFKGIIDEVEVWNTALSIAQIGVKAGLMPLSGYEVLYQPEKWSGQIQYTTNCYAYGLNLQKDPISGLGFPLPWGRGYCLQPGELAHNGIATSALSDPAAAAIIKACKDDAAYISGVFTQVNRDVKCPVGTYKVALVLDLGHDYHWYRQNPDNTWSHKTGTNPVKNTDASGQLITDPQRADRNYISQGGGNYSTFVGYFAVKPIAAGGPSTAALVASQFYNSETGPVQQNTMAATQSKIAMAGSLTRSSFAFLRLGMLVDEVVAMVGAPHRNVGSGIIMDAYDLTDGSMIVLNYGPSRDGLKKVALIRPDKTREFILQ